MDDSVTPATTTAATEIGTKKKICNSDDGGNKDGGEKGNENGGEKNNQDGDR
ncbi:GD10158 [Drosophila simulans]|uniref:GD10158 n=1 Tax=Drosophila simulans TaxID=7240 RepID=B4NV62_DROSI|nr:GD10158 [Drosophila simulans]